MPNRFIPTAWGGWRTTEDVIVRTDLRGYEAAIIERGSVVVQLTFDGWLFVAAGAEHDGASGPAIDTPDVLLGSLVHDKLYLLGRMLELPWVARRPSDSTYRRRLLEADVPWLRAWLHWLGVRVGEAFAFGLFAHLWVKKDYRVLLKAAAVKSSIPAHLAAKIRNRRSPHLATRAPK